MRNPPTQAEIDAYQQNGFVVIEDFLSTEELETWRQVTDEAVHQRLHAAKSDRWDLTNRSDDPNNYYSQVFLQCVKLADTHDGMKALMHDARLGEWAGMLAGVDGIRIWHDQALIKQPFGNPTAWHLDNPYWSFHSPNALSIWVALDDATLQNGCLYYLPGTHRNSRYDNVNIGQNMADLFRHYPEWREIEPVATPCRAGSAVFHNGLTAHGAGANMTHRPRRAMTCAYMPDGSTFNGEKNVLPPEYIEKLKIGDVLDDPEIVPLIWKRA